jgi:hypothetical protein
MQRDIGFQTSSKALVEGEGSPGFPLFWRPAGLKENLQVVKIIVTSVILNNRPKGHLCVMRTRLMVHQKSIMWSLQCTGNWFASINQIPSWQATSHWRLTKYYFFGWDLMVILIYVEDFKAVILKPLLCAIQGLHVSIFCVLCMQIRCSSSLLQLKGNAAEILACVLAIKKGCPHRDTLPKAETPGIVRSICLESDFLSGLVSFTFTSPYVFREGRFWIAGFLAALGEKALNKVTKFPVGFCKYPTAPIPTMEGVQRGRVTNLQGLN